MEDHAAPGYEPVHELSTFLEINQLLFGSFSIPSRGSGVTERGFAEHWKNGHSILVDAIVWNAVYYVPRGPAVVCQPDVKL